MSGDLVTYSGASQDQALAELIEYAEQTFSNEHMVVALPYLFAGMRNNETARAISDVLSIDVAASTVTAWLQNDDYRRVVSSGRKLMAEWNLRRLQQLSVMAMNFLATELQEPAMTMNERRYKASIAQFVIRQQSKLQKVDRDNMIDVPSLLVGAHSAAIVAERIVAALSSESTKEKRESIIGEFRVVDRDDMQVVDSLGDIVPQYGKLNVDWDARSIQCHVCESFQTNLRTHLSSMHGISVPEYRGHYGISEDIPLEFDMLENRCELDHVAWRGKRISAVDEELNLEPYFDEPEDDAEDSGSIAEISSGLGDELSETPEG